MNFFLKFYSGFGDVLEIGTQDRADIFDISAARPEPLYTRVLEGKIFKTF